MICAGECNSLVYTVPLWTLLSNGFSAFVLEETPSRDVLIIRNIMKFSQADCNHHDPQKGAQNISDDIWARIESLNLRRRIFSWSFALVQISRLVCQLEAFPAPRFPFRNEKCPKEPKRISTNQVRTFTLLPGKRCLGREQERKYRTPFLCNFLSSITGKNYTDRMTNLTHFKKTTWKHYTASHCGVHLAVRSDRGQIRPTINKPLECLFGSGPRLILSRVSVRLY